MLLTFHELWQQSSSLPPVCSLWPWDHCHGCISDTPPFFLKRDHIMLNSLGMQQQNTHSWEWMSCIPLWGTLTGYFTGMKTLYRSLPYQRHYTSYIPVCCQFVIWLIYSNFYAVWIPFGMMLSWHSQPHTVFPPPHSSNLPSGSATAKTHQEEDPENKNELEEVTKCSLLYLHSTRSMTNKHSSFNKDEGKCLLANINLWLLLLHKSHSIFHDNSE